MANGNLNQPTHFGSTIDITSLLPYTAPSDGHLVMYSSPVGAEAAYDIINVGNGIVLRTNMTGGMAESNSRPVQRGAVISQGSQGNVNYHVLHFIPLVV